MISSGSRELDEFLDGYGEEITFVYGPAASGKTTLCLICGVGLLKKDKKIVYIDTEHGFSIERFIQICGAGYITMLDRLLVWPILDFNDQCNRIDSLMNLVNVDLVIVDSLGIYYRKYVKENPNEANKKMDRQLRILTELTRRGIPVFITNQIYENPDTKEVHMVGGEMVKQWGKKIIELKKNPKRTISLKTPEEKEISFEIVESGITLLD